jgi:hypothetical protein
MFSGILVTAGRNGGFIYGDDWQPAAITDDKMTAGRGGGRR